jgi:hypothetical protein
MSEPDYVTVLATHDPRQFLVVVMKWHARDEEYIQGKVSEPLPLVPARRLAESWAAALGIEVRGTVGSEALLDEHLRSMFDQGSEVAAQVAPLLDRVPSPAAFHALAVLLSGLIISFDHAVSEGEKLGLPLMTDADRIKQFEEHLTELLPIMRENLRKDRGGPQVM